MFKKKITKALAGLGLATALIVGSSVPAQAVPPYPYYINMVYNPGINPYAAGYSALYYDGSITPVYGETWASNVKAIVYSYGASICIDNGGKRTAPWTNTNQFWYISSGTWRVYRCN